jgi:two-component system, sensor histidine kinase ChiS
MLSTDVQTTRRILVADDDPVIRHLVSSVIKQEGYTVVVANNGREAYRILQRDANFRVAIFDAMMPHLEGLDIIRHMRTEKRLMRIPVMIMTAGQNLSLMKDCFEAGATMFLPKPFTTAQVQSSLRILLSNSIGARKASTRRDQVHV